MTELDLIRGLIEVVDALRIRIDQLERSVYGDHK